MSRGRPSTREETIAVIKEFGYSGVKIKKRFRVERGVVCHWLHRHGLRLTPALRYHSDEELRDIIGMFSKLEDLQAYLNLNRSQMKDNLMKRGLQTGYSRHHRRLVDIESEVLKRIYKDCGYSIARMAGVVGVCKETIMRELRRRGIQTMRGHSIYSWDDFELYTLHITQGHSTWAIASLYGSTDKAVRNAMKKYGIQLVNNRRNGKAPPTERPKAEQTDTAWDCSPTPRAKTSSAPTTALSYAVGSACRRA